jgi:hypothetical protein
MTDTLTPQPGDVVRLDGTYSGVKNGALAVIDGTHYGLDLEDGNGPQVLLCFNASAFRGPSSVYAKDQTPYVSCSGGPLPLVPLASLVHVGTTKRRFWRWIDRPRADGGVDYARNVHLWSWTREEPA